MATWRCRVMVSVVLVGVAVGAAHADSRQDCMQENNRDLSIKGMHPVKAPERPAGRTVSSQRPEFPRASSREGARQFA
jgi:hypothetical protein